jgi:hypothetical protein
MTMISKIKGLKSGAAFLAGVGLTLILIPSGVAVAKALIYNGIEDQNGNKALVEGNGQLYTTNAPPSTLFNDGPSVVGGENATVVVNTPSGFGAVVTDLSTDFITANGQGAGSNPAESSQVEYFLGTPGCDAFISDVRLVDSSQPGDVEINFPTGLAIPNGEELCAVAFNGPVTVYSTGAGYGVPTASFGPMEKALGKEHVSPIPRAPLGQQ